MDELLVIQGGRLIDPGAGIDGPRDLVAQGGKVLAVTRPGGGIKIARRLLDSKAVRTAALFDATDLLVTPGLVDMHVHFREPGTEGETIASGSAAAAAGGFTSVATMPNTKPAVDSAEAVAAQRAAGEAAGLARIWPIAALTAGRAGKAPADVKELVAAGAVALSDDGSGVLDASVMLAAMKEAAEYGILVSDHAEDCSISGCGLMHEGEASRRHGIPGKPRASEDAMVARDIAIASSLGTRIHIAHLSTVGAVVLVAKAKDAGENVSCEVTPHHVALRDEDVLGPAGGQADPDRKMNPPLREENDVHALRVAFAQGVVDAIATDHAPHPPQAKAKGFADAPNGVTGLETAFAVCHTTLVAKGGTTLCDLVEAMTLRPALLLGLYHRGHGTLQPGAWADIAVFDLGRKWQVDPEASRSGSRNTPFVGQRLHGLPVATFLAGRSTHLDHSAKQRLGSIRGLEA